VPIFEHNGKYGLFIHIPKTGGKSVTEYLKDAGCRVSFTDDATSVLGLVGLRRPEWDNSWQVPPELLREPTSTDGVRWIVQSFPMDPSRGSWRLPVVPQHVQGDILESSLKLDKISWIFTMVRDPIERCVSRYRSAIKKMALRGLGATGKDVMIPADTFLAASNMKEDFYNWVKGSQKQWEKNPYYADNHFRPQVDFMLPRCKVFTYPHYHKLINYLEAEVGLPKSEFKKIGSNLGPIPPISSKSERLIKEWYHNDYEFFKKMFHREI